MGQPVGTLGPTVHTEAANSCPLGRTVHAEAVETQRTAPEASTETGTVRPVTGAVAMIVEEASVAMSLGHVSTPERAAMAPKHLCERNPSERKHDVEAAARRLWEGFKSLYRSGVAHLYPESFEAAEPP